MSSESPRKRASLSAEDIPPTKRQRTESLKTATSVDTTVINIAELAACAIDAPQNEYQVNRAALQRSIGLALEQVGFDAASKEALESFTLMTETCQSPAFPCPCGHLQMVTAVL